MENTNFPKNLQRFRNLEDVAHFFDSRAKKCATGYKCQCPSHEDKTASLSITENAEWFNVHCFAGCDVESVLSAKGLTRRELAKKPLPTNGSTQTKKSEWTTEKEYLYHDEKGTAIHGVLRQRNAKGSKNFPQFRVQADGSKVFKDVAKGRLVPYHLPALLEAVSQNHVIFIPEGEKDVTTLQALGLDATCNVGGAGKWRDEYSQYMKGASVVVLPDNDMAGANHGKQVAQSLTKFGCNVTILNLPDLPEKGDVSDWIASGGTSEMLLELVNTTGIPFLIGGNSFERIKGLDLKIIADCMERDERGDADLLQVLFENKRLYDATAKKWLEYKNGVWVYDDVKSIITEAQSLLSYAYALVWKDLVEQKKHINLEDDKALKQNEAKIKEAHKRWKSLDKVTKIKNALTFLESLLPCLTKDFDADPYLFNCLNGSYHFKDNIFKAHNPKDLCMKQVKVIYEPDAISPSWDMFMLDVFSDDMDTIRTVQQWAGICATGSTELDKILYAYGGGANGKSTFFAGLNVVLGAYQMQTSINLLLQKRNDSATDEYTKAQLFGTRLSVSDEVPENRKLSAEMFKSLSGGDMVTARRPFESPFQYLPTAKIAICGNHKLSIPATDYGTWRRILLVPFTVNFKDKAERGEIEKKSRESIIRNFKMESSGILNWIIDGYNDYVQNGELFESATVKNATAEYRREEDTLLDFLADCTKEDKLGKVELKVLFERYSEWCDNSGNHQTLRKPRNLSSTLKERNFLVERGTGNKVFVHGIGFIN